MIKTSLSTHKIQKSIDNALISKTVLKPDIIVLSGIKELDELTGGFKAGEITFIDGNSKLISLMPNHICVNTFRTFKSDTIYIDGGICADPYKIAKYARMMELDQKETLNHIHISRAFTVYQMTTLIQDLLEQAIKRYKPQTLIIGKFPVMYLDSDVKNKEAQTLLKINLEKIRELTTKYDLITVFTNLDKSILSNRRNMRKTLYEGVDEIVRMKQNDQCIHVDLVKKQRDTTILTFARGQLRLQILGW